MNCCLNRPKPTPQPTAVRLDLMIKIIREVSASLQVAVVDPIFVRCASHDNDRVIMENEDHAGGNINHRHQCVS
jgi:hypothetical protein